jgi:predicted nuclease with TOPRIM domain
MTFVGKILVILILAFSLFFLALSMVVFTTSTNWREAYATQLAENKKLSSDITAAQQKVQAAETSLQAEIDKAGELVKSLNKEKAELETQLKSLETQTTDLRAQVEVAQQTSKVNVEEAQALAAETAEIREQFQAAQRQANDFKAQQTQLRESITVLERQLAAAEQNNKDLRERLGVTQNFLDSRGLPTDIQQLKIATGDTVAAADVEGQVLKTDVRNENAEISIGSDDGVVIGQEYSIFRTSGSAPEYVGKIRITQTEADKSVGRIVNRYLGRKVAEGDNVAGKIVTR